MFTEIAFLPSVCWCLHRSKSDWYKTQIYSYLAWLVIHDFVCNIIVHVSEFLICFSFSLSLTIILYLIRRLFLLHIRFTSPSKTISDWTLLFWFRELLLQFFTTRGPWSNSWMSWFVKFCFSICMLEMRMVRMNAARGRSRESNLRPLKLEAELDPKRAMYSPEKKIIFFKKMYI